jgi:tetratricopeptide (TPR) repeat protein
MKDLSKIDIENFIFSCFMNPLSHEIPKIKWNLINHNNCIEILKEFLTTTMELLQPYTEANKVHGIGEDGVDLITSWFDAGLKIGWQLKSYKDLEEKDFFQNTMTQILLSKKYKCDYIVIIIASDPKKHDKKISYFISNAIQSDPKYVKIIIPEQFARILEKSNWPNIRTKGLSTMVGPKDEELEIVESLKKGDEENVSNIAFKGIAQFKNLKAGILFGEGIEQLKSNKFENAKIKFEQSLKIEKNEGTFNALGGISLLEGEWGDVIKYTDKALELNENYVGALSNKSIGLRKLGYFEEAIEYAKKCLKIESEIIEPYKLLIKSFRYGEMYKEALKFINEMDEKIKSQLNASYIDIAAIFIENGDFDNALLYYRKFLEKNNEDYRGHWGIGLCYQKKGNYEKAIEYFNKAIELNPMELDKARILFELGCCSRDTNNLDKALIYFEKARKIKPYAIEVIGNIANILRDTGKLLKAQEYYDKLMILSPSDPLVWENRGLCLCKIGKISEGFSSLEVGIKLNDNPSFGVLNNTGLAAFKLKKFKEAEEYYKMSIKKNKKNSLAFSNRGILFLNKEKYEKAIKDFQKAIELGRKTKENYSDLASCYIQLNVFDKAEENINFALDIDKEFAPAIGTLGTIFKNRGKRKKAIKLYKKALSIDPTLVFIQKNLKEIEN